MFSPEGAPPRPALTYIHSWSCLQNKLIDLLSNFELFISKISAMQFLFDPQQRIDCLLVYYLFPLLLDLHLFLLWILHLGLFAE